MTRIDILTNPMTTAGDLIVGGVSGAPSRLALGTALQVPRVNAGGTALEFAAPAGASAFVGCRVFHNTTQSMPDTGAGADVIDFNTEDFDTDAIHDAGTPSAFTVPAGKDGKWRFDPSIFLPAGTAIQVRLQARINGTPVNPEIRYVRHATLSITMVASITLELAAGDDVDFLFNQGSGGNVTIGSATASANNYLEATFMGA